MNVICDHAGLAVCEKIMCPHRVAHEPVREITTMTPGRGRSCRSPGACVVTRHQGRRMDREFVVKVRCKRVP
jgi:hypothetical protein